MRILLIALLSAFSAFSGLSQAPPIEPGVSQELAKWRAAHYSDVRYKLNLTLEKMSPVLKGTMEIRVKVSEPPAVAGGLIPIILDWRKIKGHEEKSTISNLVLNGKAIDIRDQPPATAGGSDSEHLIFSDGVVAGENVIKLDFTSPILPSGSAITRYVDKEDGSEYIYSLFVPSDASTAFPVFDQPDLKARFSLNIVTPKDWRVITNGEELQTSISAGPDWKLPMHNPVPDLLVNNSKPTAPRKVSNETVEPTGYSRFFNETKPISTYVFAFAAGPFEKVDDNYITREMVDNLPLAHDKAAQEDYRKRAEKGLLPTRVSTSLYVRKSQAAKFEPHRAEVFRLNREAVKYFEQYFDYKFPFPKYDLVLIPEFPFGGMEHAGATFLRESSIIFPQEPTKNDLVSRATLIFHEAAHQWFGDTVTMRWFDDLWLKEGFATFTAYKAMDKIMPEMNPWKVFYERIKQGAYQTDSTKGTTPIYQEIKNLSAAKSAYGNIVYNKAPAFLRQAEFYLGEEKFQTAVRAFLKKHEFANAGWEDLVKEFETASRYDLKSWSQAWVTSRGLAKVRWNGEVDRHQGSILVEPTQSNVLGDATKWELLTDFLSVNQDGTRETFPVLTRGTGKYNSFAEPKYVRLNPRLIFPNYGDYGYGIFLLDEKSRKYVLENVQNEKDPFLRSMMWGSLWDSVREGELDPRVFVELVVRVLSKSDGFSRSSPGQGTPKGVTLTEDESTVALLLNRVGTAMNYYMASGTLAAPVENMLIERMRNAETLGQRITYYRAFLNVAQSENARGVLKAILKSVPPAVAGGLTRDPHDPRTNAVVDPTNSHPKLQPPATAGGTDLPLKTKDRFDIVTRLLILNDPDAPKLLVDLEKTETSDDAKRYAYAARAAIPTKENKAKYWNDFVNNKEISESWIEAAFGPWNSIRHSELTLAYLQKALQELPNHKRNRKIFFVNGWLGAFIGGQRSEEALNIVNTFLADNPNLDKDLRLKILENVDVIERAVRIRSKYKN